MAVLDQQQSGASILADRMRFSARLRRALRPRFVPHVPIIILGTFAVVALFANFIAPYNPRIPDLIVANTPPFWTAEGTMDYPLGTDPLGRDVSSRLAHGARVSLGVALTVIAIGTVVGCSVGIAGGYFGGKVDAIVMRVVDMVLSIPLVLVAIIAAVTVGASLTNLIIMIAAFVWPRFARQVRAEVLSLREQDYVTLARVAGISNIRIMYRHILPNVTPTITVITTLQVGIVILTEASLSFLGVGVPPGVASWGGMVADGRETLLSNWWVSIFPGLAIVLAVLSLNTVGDWLRDYLDPRMKRTID